MYIKRIRHSVFVFLLVIIISIIPLQPSHAAESKQNEFLFNSIGAKGVSASLPGYGKNQDSWWQESELNLIISFKNRFTALNCGIFGLTVYIPDHALDDGKYGLELFVNQDASYHADAIGDIDFTIANGKIISNESDFVSCTHTDGITKILFNLPYSYDKPTELPTISYTVKTHSNHSGASKEIQFYNAYVLDYVQGLYIADIDFSACKAEKYNYNTDERSEWSFSNTTIGRKIYIIDEPSRLFTGNKVTLKVSSDLYKTQKLSFSSSKKKIAKISSTGKITAVKAGTTTIKVKDSENNLEYSFKLTVKDPSLNITNARSKIAVGGSVPLQSVVEGYQGGTLAWKSSKQSVGTITKDGLFIAKAPGKTTVTATDSKGYSAKTVIEVYESDNSDILQYITMHESDEASPEMQEAIYNHLADVYKSVYDMFGDGNYHYIDVYFEHIDFAAAYALTCYSEDHNEIYIGIETMANNMDDVDCATHELIHTAQNYPAVDAYGNDLTWLMEGLTDYGRFVLGLHNDAAGWSLGKYESGQNYDDSYRTTAAFIKYIVEVHDSAFAFELNNILREGKYTEQFWKDCTGYTVDELWEMYKKW